MHTQITPRNTPGDSLSTAQHQTITHHVRSWREIADLTSERHDHAMRDIRRILANLEVTDPKFGCSYRHSTGCGLVVLAEEVTGSSPAGKV